MKYNVVVTNIKLGTGKEPALTIVCYLVSLPLVPVRLLLYCWQNQLPVVRSDFPHCLPARLVIFLQPQLQPPPTGAYPKLRQASAASCSLSCVFILLPVLEFYSFCVCVCGNSYSYFKRRIKHCLFPLFISQSSFNPPERLPPGPDEDPRCGD